MIIIEYHMIRIICLKQYEILFLWLWVYVVLLLLLNQLKFVWINNCFLLKVIPTTDQIPSPFLLLNGDFMLDNSHLPISNVIKFKVIKSFIPFPYWWWHLPFSQFAPALFCYMWDAKNDHKCYSFNNHLHESH